MKFFKFRVKIYLENYYERQWLIMFKINDMVLYGTAGVCKIVDIEEKDFVGAKRNILCLNL